MIDVWPDTKQDHQVRNSRLGRRAFLHGAVATPILCLTGTGTGSAQASVLRPFSTRVIHSGHSLTDPIVPVLDTMVAAAGQQKARGRVMDRSTIPGSPMDWRWDHRNEYMPDARHDIAAYDLLVITERAPLSATLPWHDSEDVALRWFIHAWTRGNEGAGAETLLYATWVDTNSGPDFENPYKDPEGHLTFRERLPLEMNLWQGIADHVNANRPNGSPTMRVIPGPLIMAAVHDAIGVGKAPEIERIEDLFLDTIHLNGQGSYLIALAHLAVIYGYDPRDLPSGLDRLEEPAPATASWMKQLVHDVLRGYASAGYQEFG